MSRSRRLPHLLALFATAVLALAACGSGGPAAGGGEQKGGKLVVYGALHENEMARLLKAFEERSGIKTEFVRLSAGEIVARVQAEKAKPTGDVVLGGPSENHQALALGGMLQPYDSPVAKDYDKRFYDPGHAWHGFYVGALALAVNTERWKEEMKGRPIPKTWDELLDPALKDKLVVARPDSSGTAYNFVATQIFRLGEAQAWDFIKKFDTTVAHYTDSGAAPARMAGAGEYPLAIAFGHDILKPIEAGYPLEIVFPQDTGFEVGAVSIVKGGPNTESAKKFVDWMLGREAGQLHTDLSKRVSIRKDVAVPDGAVPLDQLKLVDFDVQWAAQNRDKVLRAWGERVGG
ncbi:ABC transporter substrate-binding protein [Bailinhaonella thermotolerans]|uniref:ABC transporter substrate-binding protein n=1 Tax=Bailinhaonella thermotolerans TaxID=1070861 RepID=A0A3A4B2N6_9ACTN|nr:ABC transporter substrate-binding protein [Bailinhaonella thermotolerans]RJL35985.1 ABC transporter substrate-binding protein [Bailinhaonella thermotolerans]